MRVFRSSRGCRAVVVVVVAAVAMLAATGGSAAARTLVELGGIVTPSISDFTLKPHAVSLTFETRFSTDVPGELPATIAKATIYFPHGPRINGRLFPHCDPARLQRMRGSRQACPPGSRIGGGLAIGTSPAFPGVKEQLPVDLYNGAGGRSLIFFLHGSNPVAISGMIVAPFVALHGGRWGYRVTLNVPHGLQEIIPDVFASLLDFKVTTGGSVVVHQGGRAVRYGYIETLACPPGALVPVRGVFDFHGGGSLSSDSYIACGHR